MEDRTSQVLSSLDSFLKIFSAGLSGFISSHLSVSTGNFLHVWTPAAAEGSDKAGKAYTDWGYSEIDHQLRVTILTSNVT